MEKNKKQNQFTNVDSFIFLKLIFSKFSKEKKKFWKEKVYLLYVQRHGYKPVKFSG